MYRWIALASSTEFVRIYLCAPPEQPARTQTILCSCSKRAGLAMPYWAVWSSSFHRSGGPAEIIESSLSETLAQLLK